MTATIKINGEDLRVKQTIRGLFIWEQIAGRSFEIKSTLDNYLYYYALILANNPDTALSWDDFIDAIDNDPSIILSMTKAIADTQQRDKLFESKEEGADGKKKD